MLPADRRVRRPEDFTATVRDGRRIGSSGLVLHVRTTSTPTPARAGFVVSRAVGTAVVRNRVRRRLRHLIAPHLATMPAGMSVVIRVLPAAAGLSRVDLGAAFRRGLDRAQRPVVSG